MRVTSGELRANLVGAVVGSACVFLLSGAPSVLGSEIHHEGKTYQFEVKSIRGVDYLLLEDLASTFGGSATWEADSKRFTLKVGELSVRFLPDNPFVVVDGSLVNLPLPPVLEGGRLLIPIPILSRILSRPFEKDFFWNRGTGVLTIERQRHNIEAIRIAASPSLTQVTVETAKPLSFAFKLEPSRLTLDLTGGIFSPRLSRDGPQGLVEEVTLQQFDNLARISFALRPGVGKIDTISLTQPPRAMVFLSRKAERKQPKKKAGLRKVLVDPGHGGKDPGAVGPTGYREKDANLDMAKMLKKKLEKLGLQVVLSREDDSFVSLRERTALAERKECDLFISIHCNAAPKRRRRKGRGVETYFLSEAKTDWARAVEARENAAIRFEPPDESLPSADPVFNILFEMAQNEFLNESSHLAECIQVELAEKLPTEDRGVQQAGFYVLAGAFMPAVLVEVAFISNPEEEKLLQQRWFRERAVEGMYWGVKRFKENYERKLRR